MKASRVWLCIVLFGAVLFPCVVSAVGLEAAVGLWNQDPRGYVSFDEVTAADRLSLENDLRYKKVNRIFGRIKILELKFKRFRIA